MDAPDSFFQVPLTRHPTSEGEVELPIRYHEVRVAILLFEVDAGAATELLAGTGPLGRLLEIDARGEGSAGVRARVADHDEITSLFVDGKALSWYGHRTASALRDFRRLITGG